MEKHMVDLPRVLADLQPGTVIPKPAAKASFTLKGWGVRRGERALIYLIPKHRNPAKPNCKGITVSEFTAAHAQLLRVGALSRTWFNDTMSDCAREGGCNFTTIGGIFELLGLARYAGYGVYKRC